MATLEIAPRALPSDAAYRFAADAVLTPALAVYADFVEANIATTLRLLGGDAARWRPHVKTAKLASTMRRLVERGVENFKCATSLELLTAARAGARDVLVAYPLVGANARRVRQLAGEPRDVRVSVLVDDASQLETWRGSGVGAFLDINPGMDRTGVEQADAERILTLARAVAAAGIELRGLHYYDGHLGKFALDERTTRAHAGYDRLLELVGTLGAAGQRVEEIITAGTPAFPCTLSYASFRGGDFVHRASPGTVVYCDVSSLAQLPAEWEYRPAVAVAVRVVSHPAADIVTCDAGHKTVSADAGVPTCAVLGHPELEPLSPSEEHLPLRVTSGAAPQVGDILYLVPRHVCPTVNNFDHALIVERGAVARVEPVDARGREAPLVQMRK
jgi:D-serine deaminase-like pyridoxal phosphate-dependent protein